MADVLPPMADANKIVADIAIRGLRKLKNLGHPAPVNVIFSQLGNSGIRKKITAQREWQVAMLEVLSDKGAVKKIQDGDRPTFKVGDPDILSAVIAEMAADDFSSIVGSRKLLIRDVRPKFPKTVYVDPAEMKRMERMESMGPRGIELDADLTRPMRRIIPSSSSVSALSQVIDAKDVDGTSDLADDPDITEVVQPYVESSKPVVPEDKDDSDAAELIAEPISGVDNDVIHQAETVHEFGMEEEIPVRKDPLPLSVLKASQALPPPSTPAKPLASEHPSLTDSERVRLQLLEDVLLRLADDQPYRRADLFPGEFSSSDVRWQQKALQTLADAGILHKHGDRRFTRYHGIQEKVHAILDDSEWLLRLIVPDLYARLDNGELEAELQESPDSLESESVSVDDASYPDESFPSRAPVAAASPELLSEVERLLPKFFAILEYQHERISSLEENLKSVNVKMDEMLSLLRTNK